MGNDCCTARTPAKQIDSSKYGINRFASLETPMKREMFTVLQNGEFSEMFKVEQELNRTSSSTTMIVVSQSNGTKKIVKSVKKRTTEAEDLDDLLEQLNLLNSLEHPCICKLKELYQDEKHYFLVRDYYEGGDIANRIINSKSINEKDIAKSMREIISAIVYCHARKIAYGDLKPQNIVYETKKDDSVAKLSDFGITSHLIHLNLLTLPLEVVFKAPEMIDSSTPAEPSADLWSCGAILYFLLSGKTPFKGDSRESLLENIKGGVYDFSGEEWDSVSAEAKNVIKKLMVIDPSQRATGQAILEDEWIQGTLDKQLAEISPKAKENLKDFEARSSFYHALTSLLATKLMRPDQLKSLGESYRQRDEEKKGLLQKKDLVVGFKEVFGHNTSKERIMSVVDQNNVYNEDTLINYTEMLKNALNRQNLLLIKKLDGIFKILDKNKENAVKKDLLDNVLYLHEIDWPYEMELLNIGGNGVVTKGDWVRLVMDVLFKHGQSIVLERSTI